MALEHLLGLLAALLWLALAFHGAAVKSPVTDETLHISASYAVVGLGDWRFNPEHPPLVKVLTGLVILLFAGDYQPLTDSEVWINAEEWVWANYWLFQHGERSHRLIMVARTVPILIGLLGGLIAWVWAAQFGGRRAGLFAFLMLLYYPEYLGHARFVTFDVPTAVGCGAISLAAWVWWKEGKASDAATFAFVSALAVLIKLPVLVFCMLAFATVLAMKLFFSVLARLQRRTLPQPRWRILALGCVLLFLMGMLGQWTAAGFHPRILPEDSELVLSNPYANLKDLPDSTLGNTIRFVDSHRILPQSTIAVLSHAFSVQQRSFHLFGEVRRGGYPSYFLITSALKSPLVYFVGLFLACGSVLLCLQKGSWETRQKVLLLVIPFVGLAAVTVLSGVNLGHRHILFLLIPIAVMMGKALEQWSRRDLLHRAGALAIIVIAIGVTIHAHPHQATYFNLIGGGSPYHGLRVLADSNVDWGQDLMTAKRRVDELGYKRVNMDYFGSAQPHVYGFKDFNYIPATMKYDDKLPTVVSLHFLQYRRKDFPGYFDREPIAFCNSMVIFAPKSR